MASGLGSALLWAPRLVPSRKKPAMKLPPALTLPAQGLFGLVVCWAWRLRDELTGLYEFMLNGGDTGNQACSAV